MLMDDSIIVKRKAQADYCKRTHTPHFAPESGKCYRCNKQIYEKISLEKASNELITGCPHCNYSFVE